jgi:uncharacterized protein YfaS (alpha-2-macroglobulin family)
LESTSTFGSTTTGSTTETIAGKNLSSTQGELAITQGATLFVGLLDGLRFLEQFPYGCLEQQFSALMPHIYLKELYYAVGEEYNLKQSMISRDDGLPRPSIDQAIKDLLLSLHKYQNTDGGMLYREANDNRYSHSDLNLSIQVLKNLSLLNSKQNGYAVESKMSDGLLRYLKAEFYRGNPTNCSTCKYTTAQKLAILDALLDRNEHLSSKDPEVVKEIEKMYHQTTTETTLAPSTRLLQARILTKIGFRDYAIATITEILNDDLVMNSKGAFLEAGSLSQRVQYTSDLLSTLSTIGLEHFPKSSAIIDNIQRRLINQKSNGSFGSTQDTIKVIQAIAQYLINGSFEVNFTSQLFLNTELLKSLTFAQTNKLQSSTTQIPFSALQPTNQLTLQHQGTGILYYDMTMKYYLPSL